MKNGRQDRIAETLTGIYRNGKPFQYQRAFQEEVQAVRTGGGTAAGSRVQDGEGNI